jgi:meiotically up-regulated gene 157 (Mug157) protein
MRTTNIGIVLFILLFSTQFLSAQPFQTVRIPIDKRHFSSPAIEAKIAEMQVVLQSNPVLAWLFTNCFPNTLDTTVEFEMINGKPDTFVITGDIFAMWLRDSSAQVWPYMPYMKQDKKLQQLIAGVINRQVKCILIDPYSNAFNMNKEGSEWQADLTEMKPELHERKWEVDGLCYVIRLSYEYWKRTGDISCFDADWRNAMQLIVRTFHEQQRKTDNGPYRFLRKTAKASDTQFGNGYGNPMRPTGLICSMFRPSDDATTYPFLIPANCFAVVSLKQLAEMEKYVLGNNDFAIDCEQLASEVNAGIQRYGIVNHPKYGKIYAYEVDGFGNFLMMDDANVPSLLSLPYLGYCRTSDNIYQNTRRFVWSVDNPYFYLGKVAEGIGGPHVGQDMVWPMSLIMKALTSNNKKEIAECIRILKTTHAGTGFMHESFHKDNPAKFTRSWFAWANTLFGELLIRVEKENPELLYN